MEAGQRIGEQLRLVEPLGRGGMGTVWLARHDGLDAEVAVKVVSTEGRDGQNLARLRREARLAARLSCPHVVRIFDVGEHEGRPYLVMERLEGASLAERLEGGRRLPPVEVAAVVRQLAVALEAAHREGIVHRDVKPANVFLVASDDAPFVKLLDFGVARSPDAASTLTQTGAVVGTVHYMSPEQLGGGPVDPGTDAWALAVVAYRALTGRLPFPGATVSEVAMAVERATFAPPSSLVADLGPEIDAWFKRALCRNPRLRFERPKELAEALEVALAGASDHSEGEGVPSGPLVDSDAETLEAPLDALPPDSAPEEGRISAVKEPPATRRHLAIWLLLAIAGALVAVAALVDDEPLTTRHPPSAEPAEAPEPVPRPSSPRPVAPVSADIAPSIPVATSTSVVRPPAPVRVAPPPPPAAVDCRQPFRIDEHGDYHPRPECL